jgi:3-oxoacyl-[acyl-carrier protein] reductase
MSGALAGRVALVTGGSKGIGRAVAEALAREGAKLALCARGQDALELASRELRALGAEVLVQVADVTRAGDIARFVAAAAARFGAIDILVNNAVSSTQGSFGALSDEEWRHHVDVKLLGYVRCAREALPWLEKSAQGRIVNIGGMTARDVSAYRITNGVVNAGVSNFTKHLAEQVGRHGITVNAIHPGYTQTPRMEAMIRRRAELEGHSIEKEIALRLAEIPIGRFIEPGDIANMVLFFCSQAAAAVTGQSIAVDGGSGRAINY